MCMPQFLRPHEAAGNNSEESRKTLVLCCRAVVPLFPLWSKYNTDCAASSYIGMMREEVEEEGRARLAQAEELVHDVLIKR